MNKRERSMLSVLLAASIAANIVHAATSETANIWPSTNEYKYTELFEDSILMFRPMGTEGLSVIDMNGAVIVITEYGPPLNCAEISIVTNDGTIPGPCVEGIASDE